MTRSQKEEKKDNVRFRLRKKIRGREAYDQKEIEVLFSDPLSFRFQADFLVLQGRRKMLRKE